MKKHTNYCIIDHIGALESDKVMKACYKLAYSITEKKETYTMKSFCQKISRNPNTKVSDKQKNFVRFNKHPEEVILICNEFNTNAHWIADIWAEKVEKLTVIEAVTMEVYTMQDIHPAWFSTRYVNENSIYRRCANVWANALGWSFSAPLYKDNKINATENYIRNRQLVKDVEDTSHLSKIATRPDSYLNSKAIASEEECKAFFEHYKYLQVTGLLAESLEAGYQLCPTCGRPIRESSEDCEWCTYHRDLELNFTPYYDDSYKEEDWD